MNCLLLRNNRLDRSLLSIRQLLMLCQIILPSLMSLMSFLLGICLFNSVVILSLFLGLSWKLFSFGFTIGLWMMGGYRRILCSCEKLDDIIKGIAAAK